MPSQPKSTIRAHAMATLTVAIWGFTFIATKVLLDDFAPIEILLVRFVLGLIALSIVRPHMLHLRERKHELYFIAAGITGVTLYFLCDNWALVYTPTTNVSILTTTAPLFSALIAAFVLKERRVGIRFAFGFLLALAGICLISITGSFGDLHFGNLGDFLAILGALVWAVYSVIVVKIGQLGYENLAVTKRTFAWGLLFILPLLPLMGGQMEFTRFLEPVNIGCLLYLGLAASACCFVMWASCVKRIGPTASMLYIYAQPIFTVIGSILILHEPFTARMAIGIVLVLAGLIISQLEFFGRKPR